MRIFLLCGINHDLLLSLFFSMDAYVKAQRHAQTVVHHYEDAESSIPATVNPRPMSFAVVLAHLPYYEQGLLVSIKF